MALYVVPGIHGEINFYEMAYNVNVTLTTLAADTDLGIIVYPAITGSPTAIYLDLMVDRISNTNAAINYVNSEQHLTISKPDGEATAAGTVMSGSFNQALSTSGIGAVRLYGGTDIKGNSQLNLKDGGSIAVRWTDAKCLGNNLILYNVKAVLRVVS